MIDQLLNDRFRAHEQALAPLVRQHEALQEQELHLIQYVVSCTDLAMKSSRLIDRFFWLKAVMAAVQGRSRAMQRRLFHLAARRIQAVYRVKYRERNKAIRFLASRIRPLGVATPEPHSSPRQLTGRRRGLWAMETSIPTFMRF